MLSARHDEPRSNQGAIQATGQGRESKDENESQAWRVRGSGVVPERLISSCTVNCQLSTVAGAGAAALRWNARRFSCRLIPPGASRGRGGRRIGTDSGHLWK